MIHPIDAEQIELRNAGAGLNRFYTDQLFALARVANDQGRDDLHAALMMAGAVIEGKPLTEMRAMIAPLFYEAIPEQPMKALMTAVASRYDSLIQNRGKLGVPTGITEIDRDWGGLKPKQMIVLAGESNAGKSTIALNFLNAALNKDIGVALFSIEMDCDEIADFLICLNSHCNRNHMNTGFFTPDELTAIATVTVRLCRAPLFIDDSPTLTCNQIRERTLALVEEKRIGLVIVDYAQIVSPENALEPREQQVAKVARALKALAKEASVPVLVLSQLNDEGKLRESRVLAHEAHIVALVENVDDKLQLRICKGRRVPKKIYELEYEPVFCRIGGQRANETNPNWQDKGNP